MSAYLNSGVIQTFLEKDCVTEMFVRGKKLEKQGVVYSVRCKSKRCKMEDIGETGRKLKIRMKEHEADSKVDFRKKSGKKKKINYPVFWNI